MRCQKISLGAAALFTLLAGCYSRTVVVSDSPPRRTTVVEERRSDDDFDAVVDVDEDDAGFVVYREYYGCTDEEISFIPYYRRYYVLDDGDLFFLFFVARHTHQPIDVVIRSYYYDCGRDCDRLVVSCRMDRSIFFVELPGSYSPGGAYERPYRCYRERSFARAQFTNVEFHALVTLKIGVEYQGEQPEQFIGRVRENPSAPQKAIFRSRDSLGKGGRDVEGHGVSVRAQRAWTMPEKEKQKFHEERHEKAARNGKPFEEKHAQRVGEVRKGDVKRTPEAKDAGRDKDAERQKQVEREKELERKKHEKDPKEPGKPKD